MPKTKTIPRSNVGDKVRVCSGVSDPDYDDLTIGRWAGTIAEVQDGTPRTLLVPSTLPVNCHSHSRQNTRSRLDRFNRKLFPSPFSAFSITTTYLETNTASFVRPVETGSVSSCLQLKSKLARAILIGGWLAIIRIGL